MIDGSGLSLEVRIAIMTVVLVILAILLSVAFVALAVGAEMWGMLAGVPVAILGGVLVLVGRRRRLASDGGRIGVSVLGGVLVVGSTWVAFMTNNAIIA